MWRFLWEQMALRQRPRKAAQSGVALEDRDCYEEGQLAEKASQRLWQCQKHPVLSPVVRGHPVPTLLSSVNDLFPASYATQIQLAIFANLSPGNCTLFNPTHLPTVLSQMLMSMTKRIAFPLLTICLQVPFELTFL